MFAIIKLFHRKKVEGSKALRMFLLSFSYAMLHVLKQLIYHITNDTATTIVGDKMDDVFCPQHYSTLRFVK